MYILKRSERHLRYKRRVAQYRNQINFFIRWHVPVTVTGIPKKYMRDNAEACVLKMLILVKVDDDVALAGNLAIIFKNKVDSHGRVLHEEGRWLIQYRITTKQQLTDLYMQVDLSTVIDAEIFYKSFDNEMINRWRTTNVPSTNGCGETRLWDYFTSGLGSDGRQMPPWEVIKVVIKLGLSKTMLMDDAGLVKTYVRRLDGFYW